MGYLKVLAFLVMAQQALAVRNLRFASPLQSLTIPDPEVKEIVKSSRQKFLPKYKAGLKAEIETRKELAAKRTKELQAAAASGGDWAEQAAESQRQRRSREERLVEQAFDKATTEAEKALKVAPTTKSSNAYQFVGVVNRGSAEKPVTWYARPKRENAKWSVRLVHVNRDAIIKDLFNRGKVDIFAKYRNTGSVDETTKTPIISSKYDVRERSWKNLWNFSPKHVFTDPSGMYWRERRIRPGMYTDGANVYEASYRYGDGRNGMRRITNFQQFMASKSIGSAQKDKITKRLKDDVPDVVLED